jgi:hypothetical protein
MAASSQIASALAKGDEQCFDDDGKKQELRPLIRRPAPWAPSGWVPGTG